MIMECEIQMDKRGYCQIRYNEYTSAAGNNTIADSLSRDMLYQDASWYRARARECGEKYKWQNAGTSSGNIGFDWNDLLVPAKMRLSRIIQKASDKKFRKILNGKPATFKFKFVKM